MKNLFLMTLTAAMFVSCVHRAENRTDTQAETAAQAQTQAQTDSLIATIPWSQENYRQHILNREDPHAWDKEMLRDDIDDMDPAWDSQRLMSGVFPQPRYDVQMKETFKGCGFGTGGRFLEIEGRKICYNFFFTGRNINNAPFLGERENEVFFLILTLVDTEQGFEDWVNGGGLDLNVLSRNNPDVMALGRVTTGDSKVEYIAFLTADRNNYAVVNTRLFDLRFGRTVFIAPQKDGSFRSLQSLDTPLMTSGDVNGYVDSLILRPEVRQFFLASGNIE